MYRTLLEGHFSPGDFLGYFGMSQGVNFHPVRPVGQWWRFFAVVPGFFEGLAMHLDWTTPVSSLLIQYPDY